MKCKSDIHPSWVLETLRNTVEEKPPRFFREAYEVTPTRDGFVMCIWEGIISENNLYWDAKVIPTEEGCTIEGPLTHARGERTEASVRAAKYMARGTGVFLWGLVCYVIALGILFLLDATNFVFPLVAPITLWILQAVWAVIVRKTIKKRLIKYLDKHLQIFYVSE